MIGQRKLQKIADVAQTAMQHREDHHLEALNTKLTRRIDAQERALQIADAQLKVLRRTQGRQKSGGFPWELLILGAAGYYLWRNPDTRTQLQGQVQGLMQRLNPGVEGNVARAGDAVRGTIDDLSKGEDPTANVKAAVGEASRGAEKAADKVRAKVDDVRQDARMGVQRAADDVNRSR
ncbi:hypothetical protein [Deinococcus maricopensis]|uniref:Lea76/Lea29-like desiccation resistance protein n=1 Tax=Deinococcus maricopensis (strain DSM 21211 / LMG 22137 / NRRL B-23946 / LB-34) TaxID=709986 RepID=E8U4B4_DEIML|nr:hypothetical protein [Deinococcus maricopensis]ADV65951.1 hypothetical protein Deima_0290 [Deinococcus maricopensis DSM 21211]